MSKTIPARPQTAQTKNKDIMKTHKTRHRETRPSSTPPDALMPRHTETRRDIMKDPRQRDKCVQSRTTLGKMEEITLTRTPYHQLKQPVWLNLIIDKYIYIIIVRTRNVWSYKKSVVQHVTCVWMPHKPISNSYLNSTVLPWLRRQRYRNAQLCQACTKNHLEWIQVPNRIASAMSNHSLLRQRTQLRVSRVKTHGFLTWWPPPPPPPSSRAASASASSSESQSPFSSPSSAHYPPHHCGVSSKLLVVSSLLHSVEQPYVRFLRDPKPSAKRATWILGYPQNQPVEGNSLHTPKNEHAPWKKR